MTTNDKITCPLCREVVDVSLNSPVVSPAVDTIQYKAFNVDSDGQLYCEPAGGQRYNYTVRITHVINEQVYVGSRGFHSCVNLADCLHYYPLYVNTRYARVRIGGTVKTYRNVTVSSKITIIDVLSYEELYSLLGLHPVNVYGDTVIVVADNMHIYHKLNNAIIGHIYRIEYGSPLVFTSYNSDGNLHTDFTDQDVRDSMHATAETFGLHGKKIWYRRGLYYAIEYPAYIVWTAYDIRECKSCGKQSDIHATYKCNCKYKLISPIIKRIRSIFNKH
jgi:hypothetical protein